MYHTGIALGKAEGRESQCITLGFTLDIALGFTLCIALGIALGKDRRRREPRYYTRYCTR